MPVARLRRSDLAGASDPGRTRRRALPSRRSMRCPVSRTPCSSASTGMPRSTAMTHVAPHRAPVVPSATGRGSPRPVRPARRCSSALVDAAGDVPFLGPNCYGFVNTFDGVALWPDEHGMPIHSTRAWRSSRRAATSRLNLTFQQRGLRLGYMVTVGNQADIGIEDCIDALLDDARMSAVGMFLEGSARSSALRRGPGRSAPPRVCRSWRCTPDDRPPALAIAASHTARSPGTGLRTPRCSSATAWSPWTRRAS